MKEKLKKMDLMEIRIFMKERGWYSHDRISTFGWGDDFGYSIWFERWDWHGRNTVSLTGDKVCFHSHTDDLTQAIDSVREAASLALRAYEEFTDTIPEQGLHGEIKEARMTVKFEEGKISKGRENDGENQ